MWNPALLAAEPVRPLTREMYERMVECGVLGPEDRVELLHGALVEMSPQGPVHAQIATELLNYLVNAAIARGLLVRLHSPFAAGPHSEPEPDFALVPAADYRSGHPTEAALIVEVADSSRRRDLVVKPAIYARANVPEYWVADLVARVVLVHRDPVGESYTSVTEHRAGEALACAALPDVAIPVERLLP